MGRPSRLVSWGLITGLALLSSACGGGGGGAASNLAPSPTVIATQGEGKPTATPTPLRAGTSLNERTESSGAGSITLRIQDTNIFGQQVTAFSVFLTDASGRPVAGQQIEIDSGLGVVVVSPEGGLGTTGPDGSLSGSLQGISGGRFLVTATATSANSPFKGLSVSLTVVVNAPRGTPTPAGAATATPTVLPCDSVQTIIVQTDTPNVSSLAGGKPKITAVVFDQNNLPVPNVNLLFDVLPRIATFKELIKATDSSGTAQTELIIAANSPSTTLLVSVSACGKAGSVSINIVSGVSTKPVATVVLQADPPTVGSLTGGNVNLTAFVLDVDNAPINGLDVLFIAPVGKVNPLIDRSRVSGSQGGVGTSVLQIPVGAVEKPYPIIALAGGVNGTTTVTVVPGRGEGVGGTKGVPPGEPASITLGASPTRIQVSGTGGTELASVVGRVFDNNGNALANVPVRYHVVAAQSAPGAVILAVTSPTPSGTPSPTPATKCAKDDPVSITDTAGFAVIQVRSGSQPGPVTIAACADTIVDGVPSPLIEQQALITVTSGPVSRIALSINTRFVDNNDGTLLTVIGAILTDAQGNTVEDGTPVSFELLTRQVCSGGSNDGRPCSSSAACGGGTCIDDPTDPARSAAITSNSTTNGNPPCDISQFVAQTGLPITPQPGTAITCIRYPEHQQGVEVLVRATVAGVTNNISGQSLPLPGRIGDLEAGFSPSTVKISDTSEGLATVRAVVSDLQGDPVENVRVRFSTSLGTIDRSILTNDEGEAIATLTIPAGAIAAGASGTATLRVSAGGLQIIDISIPIVNTGGIATPTPGTSSQPAAIRFVGAEPAVIGVRGSGLREQSILTFQVTDGLGVPVANVPVNFSLARIADETIAPLQDVTDDKGNAQVTLTSGTRALSIQITAQVNTPAGVLVTRSTAVTIVGGPPSQPNFSLAQQYHNISGRVTFGLTDVITAFVGDRFGNPVPPGTAVSFTTKGGVIGNPTTTNALGQASGTLVSQLPIANTGTVASLATTQGERPFIDKNGNGICDDQDDLQTISEPFYDENCNGIHDPQEDYSDLNGNHQFDADQINPQTGVPACNDQVTVFASICTTFSGPTNVLLFSSGTGPLPAGGSRDYTFIVSDNPDPIGNPGVGNPIVGGSTIAVTTQGARARVVGLTNLTLPDLFTNDRIIDGANRFQFSVVDNNPLATIDDIGAVVVTVTSSGLPAGGNGSVITSAGITFLAAPSATPTVTTTPTSVPPPTATAVPPKIVPTQIALSAGTGAPPNSCNGGTQTFVVTGGSPPFTVGAGGGCVSATSIPASGGSFVFTAGNTIGDSSITITDGLGRTVSAGVTVLGPPTPTFTQTSPPTLTPTVTPTSTPTSTFTSTPPPTITPSFRATPSTTPVAGLVQLSQVRDRVNDNSDGTFTILVSALVSDANGISVGDGVAVEFTLVNPVRGVSVTSPGFTNQNPICTVGFPVVLQPGDAFSCLKYSADLQGTTVLVRARVQTPSGAFVEDVREVILTDTRPTVTPINTATATATETPLPTATPTLLPPAIAPISATLFAGVGAPPGCNGITRSFTVTGAAPPFTLSAGGAGCLSTNLVTASGGTFTYTSGSEVGSFVITAIDALGRIATAGIGQQAPPATFISVDLFEDRRSDNGDGTFTSIATALVTDAAGATIVDGVPVEFSLVDPVSGVSITSPGLTDAMQPCVAGSLTVQPQPGDALACIKYVSSRQGSTITIRARVTSATNGVLEAVKTVTLPDTRSTPTFTATRTLTASLTPTVTPTPTPFPEGLATFTPTVTQTVTPLPPVGSIEFIGANPVALGVRASGRPEQSLLTFVVRSTLGLPLSGIPVTFTLSGTGTETLNPASAVSGSDGTVVTTVTSGTRAASVRVRAGADTDGNLIPDVFAQSIGVSILGAPPSQNRFSIAPTFKNIPGRRGLGLTDKISVFANDRFGNAVPQGTAISFVTNGASIVNPTTTDVNGVASATLLSEQVIPPSGIVTIMGFTHGEEAFLDNNGNGAADPGEPILTDDIPEPFVDFRPLPPGDAFCTIPAPSPLCNNAFDPSTPFEFFIDTVPQNGVWGPQGTSGKWDDNILVNGVTQVTFSGSPVQPVFTPGNGFTIPDGGSLEFTVEVHDDLGNPLKGPFDSLSNTYILASITIFDTALNASISGGFQTIPDAHSFNQTIDGVTRFHFVLFDNFPGDLLPPQPVQLSIRVDLFGDGTQTFVGPSGTID